MNKVIVAVAVIFAMLFSFGGNEIYKNDISNRLIIQGIGIDEEKDGSYTVTLQAINTSIHSASANESGNSEPVKLYKVHGDTVYTAIKSAVELEGKIPLYSQNRIIIISRSIGEKGIEGIADFFSRDAHNAPAVFVALAENRAGEILEAKNEGEIIADNIVKTIESAEYEAEIYKLELYELVNRYLDKGSAFSMPVLTVEEENGEKSIKINGTALFYEGKLRGKLTNYETQMLNFICGNVYNGEFSFEADEKGKTAMSIVNCKTSRKVKMTEGVPNFTIKIKLNTDIAEVYNGIEKNMDRERLKELSRSAEDYLQSEILKVLDKLYKDEMCDVPGLSRLIFQKYSSVYREYEKNLNTLMAKSRFSVEVRVNIRRVGHEFVKTAG